MAAVEGVIGIGRQQWLQSETEGSIAGVWGGEWGEREGCSRVSGGGVFIRKIRSK